MENLVKDFLKQKSFAVAGSFRDETKYAYRIFKTLVKKGYQVYPVNPYFENVGGVKCYKSISDIPFDIGVVSVVTPPSVTETIVKECREKFIRRVWLQPGAENKAAIEFCRGNNIDVIYGLCIMLKSYSGFYMDKENLIEYKSRDK